MKKNDVLDYDFKCIDSSEYFLVLSMVAKKKMVDWLLQKTKDSLKRKGHQIKGERSSIPSFKIPSQYHNLIAIGLNKVMRRIEDEVRKEGSISLLDYTLKEAYFAENEEGGWTIELHVHGLYKKV